jgi:hypothetical protein
MAESVLNAAEERRRAKEAYMQSLADMKGKAIVAQAAANSYNIAAASQTQLTAAQKRELMLEEKRKNFFAKQSDQPLATSESSTETKTLYAAKDKFDLRQSNYEGELNVQQNNNFQEMESQVANTSK